MTFEESSFVTVASIGNTKGIKLLDKIKLSGTMHVRSTALILEIV